MTDPSSGPCAFAGAAFRGGALLSKTWRRRGHTGACMASWRARYTVGRIPRVARPERMSSAMAMADRLSGGGIP